MRLNPTYGLMDTNRCISLHYHCISLISAADKVHHLITSSSRHVFQMHSTAALSQTGPCQKTEACTRTNRPWKSLTLAVNVGTLFWLQDDHSVRLRTEQVCSPTLSLWVNMSASSSGRLSRWVTVCRVWAGRVSKSVAGTIGSTSGRVVDDVDRVSAP